MLERMYRQRLETDLARWQTDGVITAAAGDAIRGSLRPLPRGVDIATVVAIVGGLLIAAAFLAFVAANWTAIARPARFAILLAGIAGAYGTGALFDRMDRPYLADLACGVASLIFGAAIALVGQMYHIGGDLAGGMLLWAAGSMAAAVLTGSRAALAIALATACVWSGMRVHEEAAVPHLPFIALWLIAAALAVAWNAPVARHLVALAMLPWWITTGMELGGRPFERDPAAVVAAGMGLHLGAGLLLASRGPPSLRALGLTMSAYAAFANAIALAWAVAGVLGRSLGILPYWILACALVGVASALAAAVLARRPGPAFTGLAIGLCLVVAAGLARPAQGSEPWLAYALALATMLSLVISGMLDDARSRVVAGWIGLASMIAAITWAVRGSLLRRALFLAVAGLVAVGLATLLARLLPKERPQ
jgi:Predicted membrane protein (DUF2157)